MDRKVNAGTDTTQDSSPEKVLASALRSFATAGYSRTKLEEVARESGMSKRMIHYHFGDKRGLYNQCIVRAIELLRPTPDEMEIDSGVPVEGVRKVVEAVFKCYVEHPDCARLLALENIHHYGTLTDATSLLDQSATMLQLDRLLMVGQDAGAFRPGISAVDVFTLIASLAHFRVNVRYTTIHLYGVDLMDEENTAGMTRMAVDTVLAFLTSNLQTEDEVSYLKQRDADANPDPLLTEGIYDIANDPFFE